MPLAKTRMTITQGNYQVMPFNLKDMLNPSFLGHSIPCNGTDCDRFFSPINIIEFEGKKYCYFCFKEKQAKESSKREV